MEILIHEELYRLTNNILFRAIAVETALQVKKKLFIFHFLVLITWYTKLNTSHRYLCRNIRAQFLLNVHGLRNKCPCIIGKFIPLGRPVFHMTTIYVAIHIMHNVGQMVMCSTLRNTSNLLDFCVEIALNDFLVFFWIVITCPFIETAEFEGRRPIEGFHGPF